jgi:hypothetical protein
MKARTHGWHRVAYSVPNAPPKVEDPQRRTVPWTRNPDWGHFGTDPNETASERFPPLRFPGDISVGPPFCPESLNVFEAERLVFASRLFIIASSRSATWRSCPMRSAWRTIVVFIPGREPDYAATTTVPLARLTQGSTYPAFFCSAVSPASTSI